MEDQEEQEFDLCSRLTRKEITAYVDIVVSTQTETVLDPTYLGDLKRLGGDLKEIQRNVEGHLNECFTCKQYYDSEYEVSYVVHGMRILTATPVADRYFQEGKSFLIDHAFYDKIHDLEFYILHRVLVEVDDRDFPIVEEFERHMKDCDSCKNYYQAELAAMREYFEKQKKRE